LDLIEPIASKDAKMSKQGTPGERKHIV